ncbi:hypothetical protein J2T21_003805 [Paeniglutamicibacter psychrophenolicus]|nr:hypothetical protein [Paeniglutamicibacter psychrophenolicus]
MPSDLHGEPPGAGSIGSRLPWAPAGHPREARTAQGSGSTSASSLPSLVWTRWCSGAVPEGVSQQSRPPWRRPWQPAAPGARSARAARRPAVGSADARFPCSRFSAPRAVARTSVMRRPQHSSPWSRHQGRQLSSSGSTGSCALRPASLGPRLPRIGADHDFQLLVFRARGLDPSRPLPAGEDRRPSVRPGVHKAVPVTVRGGAFPAPREAMACGFHVAGFWGEGGSCPSDLADPTRHFAVGTASIGAWPHVAESVDGVHPRRASLPVTGSSRERRPWAKRAEVYSFSSTPRAKFRAIEGPNQHPASLCRT